MGKLIYVVNASLDGFSEDRDGGIVFGSPDEEYFGFINDLERSVGTYLYGRRMYEAMMFWETSPIADQPPWVVDFTNLWRSADKVVYSKTLASVSSGRTTLEQEFDVEAVWRMKADKPTISQWAEQISLPERLGRAWWTSATCSSGPSCLEVENRPFQARAPRTPTARRAAPPKRNRPSSLPHHPVRSFVWGRPPRADPTSSHRGGAAATCRRGVDPHRTSATTTTGIWLWQARWSCRPHRERRHPRRHGCHGNLRSVHRRCGGGDHLVSTC